MKSVYFILFVLLTTAPVLWAQESTRSNIDCKEYFPLPDSLGGWKTLTDAEDIRKVIGFDKSRLDSAFDFVRSTTKNGGLLVVRHGWLVYEKYFGKGNHDAVPNIASSGKVFTSISMGILIGERPDLFPDGLDQKVFTPTFLPAKAFPLSDPRMADIKLGQLLTFTAGIRGNNPVIVHGKDSTISPIGPDGWISGVDDYALGLKDGVIKGKTFTTKTLWCDPGDGYSYSSASIHIVSIILRTITGVELEEYIQTHIAKPSGWGTWGYGFKNQPLLIHSHGDGGIAIRSTDVLRFCYLLLHEGRWNQQQIVSKEYIRMASIESPYNSHYAYSLQFRVNTDGNIPELPKDLYYKGGSGGHCLYIIPSLDLIVWKLGGRDEQYSEANTGFPEPPKSNDFIEPIKDGKIHDTDSDVIKTMIMVLEAMK